MKAIGTIAYVTKGLYDPSVTYKEMDVVLYSGSLWEPKKETTGNAPPETQQSEDGTPASNEWWKLFLPGALGDDYVKKTELSKAPTGDEPGKPGVNFPDGKTIKIDGDGMLTGVPLDFIGDWKELQESMESGEVTEGMTGFIFGSEGGSEDPDHPNSFLFDIDDFLSTVSSNAVQNRIVTAALNRIEELANQNKQIIEETKALRATLTEFGMGKICPTDLVDATEDNGLVLGAKEKNASVSGSLANGLESIRDFFSIKQVNITLKENVGQSYGMNAYRSGNSLFISMNILPSRAISNEAVATIQGVSLASPFYIYKMEYDSTHKVRYELKNITGGISVLLDTEGGSSYYCIMCCSVLVR